MWAEWRVEVHEATPLPDGRVAIVMTMHFRGKESGAILSEITADRAVVYVAVSR